MTTIYRVPVVQMFGKLYKKANKYFLPSVKDNNQLGSVVPPRPPHTPIFSAVEPEETTQVSQDDYMHTPIPSNRTILSEYNKRDGYFQVVGPVVTNATKYRPVTREEQLSEFNITLGIFEAFVKKMSIKNGVSKKKQNKCNDADKEMIMDTSVEWMSMSKYTHLHIREVYVVFIYVYYILNLLEQTSDALNLDDISVLFNKDTFQIATDMVSDITIRDIQTTNNENISSIVRRRFMGLIRVQETNNEISTIT